MAVTYDLIASSTPAGTTTATFNSLGSYTDLILQCYFSATIGSDFDLRFNSDSGSNYYYLQGYSTSSVFDNASANGGSSIRIIGAGNSPQGDPDFNQIEITIPEYRNSIVKNANYRFAYISNPVTPNANSGFGTGSWRNTSAITSVSISTSSGTFATGSVINLYGVTAGNA
jgi:hypothetical protein